MVTLPNTGTEQSFPAVIGGMLLTAVGYFTRKTILIKKRRDIWQKKHKDTDISVRKMG